MLTLTDDPNMFYYKPGNSEVKFICLDEHTFVEVIDKVKFTVVTYKDFEKKKKKEYTFRCQDKFERDNWITCIKE